MPSRQHVYAAILVCCALLIAFWQVMAHWSRKPWRPFELTAADFENFHIESGQWQAERKPPGNDPLQPNVLVLLLSPTPNNPRSAASVPVLVRLVHGYNVCDCMRIKGYTVDLLADARGTGKAGHQLWRLTSGAGDVSIWATSMLRAGDLARTDVDVRSMAFPRIGTPDDPRWVPEGLTLKSLRHPIRHLRWFLRAKWNNARADWLTFLGLKQPAWASDEMLTLVSAASVGPGEAPNERAEAEHVLAAHHFTRQALQTWKAGREK